MKKHFLLFFAMAALMALPQQLLADDVVINEQTFPDENFRNWVLAQDYGTDGILTEAEIAVVTKIDVNELNIENLKGIELFPALTYLRCYRNKLTIIDISKNTKLTTLICNDNPIDELNVSENIALKELYVINCQLTSLDLSKNTALTRLYCDQNLLTSLDVSENTALTSIMCRQNQLSALDVSKNKALKVLDCSYNQLADLDVTKNDALGQLWCISNQLTTLDVTKNTMLNDFYCADNQLTSLDLSNITKLRTLECNGNELTSLDVSKNIALTKLQCYGNQLTSLGLSKNTALKSLSCFQNQLTSLDLSKNTALTFLSCHSNQLTSLDLSQNTALNSLSCYRNQINETEMGKLVESLPTNNGEFYAKDLKIANEQNVITTAQVAVAKAKGWKVYAGDSRAWEWDEYDGDETTGIAIDETNFPDENFRNWVLAQNYGQDGVLTEQEIAGVTEIVVGSQNIADLKGIEYFTALTRLICWGNQLTSLGVSHNTALTTLDCSNNQLTSLDVSQNAALTKLYCSSNRLASLDVSQNTALTTLDCGNNQLASLDVSQNMALKDFNCVYNQLTTLEVSQNAALTTLDCFYNQLTSLDVSQNTALMDLNCCHNQLTSLDLSQNTALITLNCYGNQLTFLDVSQNTALTWLLCDNNQLTSLDVSQNTALMTLYCYSNQIKGAAMDVLIAGLPSTGGRFYVIDPDDSNEQNVVTKAQATAAKEKGWTASYWSFESNDWLEYEGSDPEIAPVEQGETISIGNEIDASTDLGGNVVGDVFYSISSGDGSYDPAEGCIVVTKPTDDAAIDGKDIFGEDFKAGYTGIVFKVAPGAGTVKVEAQTQGNMVLKVKIGNGQPVTMKLEGKLKVSFPYNVSEETLVYIYGGTNAAGAKGMMKAVGTDMLKIYGIEVTSEKDGIKAIDNGQLTIGNTPVYNLNGQRVEKPGKGIYIQNGRKVLVK